MSKDKNQYVKNAVYLFTGKGKLLKIIRLETIIQPFKPDVVWALIAFNSEEDLVLVTSSGVVYLLDIYHAALLHTKQIPGLDNQIIREAKFQAWLPPLDKGDTVEALDALVLRTNTMSFYSCTGVVQSGLSVLDLSKMQQSQRIMDGRQTRMESEVRFCIGVVDRTRKQIKVFLNDPENGLHEITQTSCDYITHFSNKQLIGKVLEISLTSDCSQLALFANSHVIVCSAKSY